MLESVGILISCFCILAVENHKNMVRKMQKNRMRNRQILKIFFMRQNVRTDRAEFLWLRLRVCLIMRDIGDFPVMA